MEWLWGGYGVSMGWLWGLYGISMGYGVCMGCLWHLYGVAMGSLWGGYGGALDKGMGGFGGALGKGLWGVCNKGDEALAQVAREAVVDPFLDTLKVRLDRTQRDLIWSRCPCSLQWGWTGWPLRIPSNSNNSMIL